MFVKRKKVKQKHEDNNQVELSKIDSFITKDTTMFCLSNTERSYTSYLH